MNDYELYQRCRMMRDSGKKTPVHVRTVRTSLTDTAGIWDDERLVCVDGSDTWQEWVGNILAFRTGQNGAHQSYDRAGRGIFSHVAGSIRREQEWTVAGISRGGAIAQALALYIASCGAVVRVVTFGAPKAGSKRFRDACEKSIASATHYQIDGDIVCRLPHWWSKPAGEIVRLPQVSRNIIENHLSYGAALRNNGGVYV